MLCAAMLTPEKVHQYINKLMCNRRVKCEGFTIHTDLFI